LPLVLAENARLQDKRQWLLSLDTRQPLSAEELEQLAVLQDRYKLSVEDEPEQAIRRLLGHIDKVPVALVLAQAANESGWGSSRFVQEGNNLFGEWTWKAEEGIAPLVRNEESRHYVRRFDSLADSVRAYIYNLNAGHAYQDLRRMRAEMRARGAERFDALSLATGLERYSARGEEYVLEIQQMIRGNRLQQLGPLELEQ
jgi:Bax protein